jgi:hypothetical protein
MTYDLSLWTVSPAFGLAEPYVDHWPQPKAHAVSSDGLMYVKTPDWRSRRIVSDVIGDAPTSIREKPGRGRTVRSDGVVPSPANKSEATNFGVSGLMRPA